MRFSIHPARLRLRPPSVSGTVPFPHCFLMRAGTANSWATTEKRSITRGAELCARLRVKNRGCILGADPSRRRGKRWGMSEEVEGGWYKWCLLKGKTVWKVTFRLMRAEVGAAVMKNWGLVLLHVDQPAIISDYKIRKRRRAVRDGSQLRCWNQQAENALGLIRRGGWVRFNGLRLILIIYFEGNSAHRRANCSAGMGGGISPA